MAKRPVSKAKAHEILEHGEVRGHKLTPKQRGLFGAVAGGSPLRKYQHSPDRYDDAALGEAPPRQEYHREQEGGGETDKKAGGTPAAVRQTDGTQSLGSAPKTKSSTRREAGAGRTRWPALDTYQDEEV